MDHNIMFAISINNVFLIAKCLSLVATKYNLTWKLKKCQWCPKKIEFVGADISEEGNSPAQSKKELILNWKYPQKPRDIMAFIGFAIFYSRWIPFFEQRVASLREVIKSHEIDKQLSPDEFTSENKKEYDMLKKKLTSAPILQRAQMR